MLTLMFSVSQLRINAHIRFAEVQFFFRTTILDQTFTMALVSTFSRPERPLWEVSHGTLGVCEYCGEAGFKVVDVKNILSVVAMVPFKDTGSYYANEKLGLEVFQMGGAVEELTEE